MCTQQFREAVSRASRNAAPDEKERVTAFVAAAAADSFLGGSKSRPPRPSFLLALTSYLRSVSPENFLYRSERFQEIFRTGI
jgi:hypothetical protein